MSLGRDLTYMNYAHNRRHAPDITPEQWGKVYGEEAVRDMEIRLWFEEADLEADRQLDERRLGDRV